MKSKYVKILLAIALVAGSFFLGANLNIDETEEAPRTKEERDSDFIDEVNMYNDYALPIHDFFYYKAKDINKINGWAEVVLSGQRAELKGEGNGQLEANKEILMRDAANLLADTKELDISTKVFKDIERRASDAKKGYIAELEYYVEVANTDFKTEEEVTEALQTIEKNRKHRVSAGNDFLFYIVDTSRNYYRKIEEMKKA